MFDHDELPLGPASQDPVTSASGSCAGWLALLPDAAEGLLNDTEQRALDQHLVRCAVCAKELAEARRGAAWLGLLKGHSPDPPAALLSSILARTTGASPAASVLGAAPVPVMPRVPVAEYPVWAAARPMAEPATAFRQRLAHWFGLDQAFAPALQPRLAMTVAMAFFSICLTVNLLGFSVRDIQAQVMHPAAGIQRTVADTSASLVRSFEGIRVVYRLESRVNEWRTASAPQGEALLPTAQ